MAIHEDPICGGCDLQSDCASEIGWNHGRPPCAILADAHSTSSTSQETTAIGPVVDAALELVKRCTELGISHAVQLNISGTKLTIERG
jgi:hypothetical protein